MSKASILAAICPGMSTETAVAEGDIAEGEKVFQRCVTCHSATDKINKQGPYLQAVIGRPVASVEGFTYSAPMTAFGATGAVWDEATLDRFFQGPTDFVNGTKMMVPPVRRDTERADLIAFLKSHM